MSSDAISCLKSLIENGTTYLNIKRQLQDKVVFDNVKKSMEILLLDYGVFEAGVWCLTFYSGILREDDQGELSMAFQTDEEIIQFSHRNFIKVVETLICGRYEIVDYDNILSYYNKYSNGDKMYANSYLSFIGPQVIEKHQTDMVIYMNMISDIRPKVIIEIGTAYGTSAMLLKGYCKMFSIDTKIITLDINEHGADEPGIMYVKGDVNQIDALLPISMLIKLPHPWIVIEDCHTNIEGIIKHITRASMAGDYLVLEDMLEGDYIPAFKEINRKACRTLQENNWVVDNKYVKLHAFGKCGLICRQYSSDWLRKLKQCDLSS